MPSNTEGAEVQVITSVQDMQETANGLRASGETIGFVPTMGYLHEGHLKLVEVAKETATKVVVSIFVNPTQFGPKEDFERYPRDIKADLRKLSELNVDFVFIPEVSEMYPKGFQTYVSVKELTKGLCGASRPGHFEGVATVVTKLFNIVKPHFAVFGQKDYQQLTVITRMVRDLNMDIEIIGVPTVREPDGLAMSSRNSYLKPQERDSALSLYKSINKAQEMVSQGERDVDKIVAELTRLILSHPYTKIDYVKIVDPTTLEELKQVSKEALLALAVFVGDTRLIDNAIIHI